MECLWQGMLQRAIFNATCVAEKLQDKLYKKLPSVTDTLKTATPEYCKALAAS